MLKEGLYTAQKDDGFIYDNYTVSIKVRETEKSYIFELVEFKSRYGAVQLESFFRKSNRVVLNKERGGHGIRVWGDDSFTLYPYQAGVPYYFELTN